jgi:hypothetical protein
MKIGIIIPDRNDRPELLANCKRMIYSQVFTENHWTEIKPVTFQPTDNEIDITKRYRIGYDYFRNRGFDCILLMENDDFYSKNYIQTMVNEWILQGKPKLLGTNYTIYYHLGLRKYLKMRHDRRASAMNTLIVPDLDINWCPDSEPYTDLFLWRNIQGVTFKPKEIISIGIKHGTGLCGGNSHKNYLDRYRFDDPHFEFLHTHMDSQSFKFYTEYAMNLNENNATPTIQISPSL